VLLLVFFGLVVCVVVVLVILLGGWLLLRVGVWVVWLFGCAWVLCGGFWFVFVSESCLLCVYVCVCWCLCVCGSCWFQHLRES